MFHHDSTGKARFGGGGGMGRMTRGAKETGEQSQPKPKPMVNRTSDQAPHEGHNIKHVTETHPGTTSPHPATGIHAVHTHHMGGGRYQTHHHHEGGNVEVRDHESVHDAHQAAQESLPDEGKMEREEGDYGEDYGSSMGGIGGMGAGDGE
jgi:hypothetical protein